MPSTPKNPKAITKKAQDKAGFYEKNPTSAVRKNIIKKVTTKPQRVAMVEKMMLAKKEGGSVNAAGNYTKPDLRKRIVSQVKSAAVQGTGAGQWSARKAQLVAKKYKDAGGGYRD